MIEFFFGATNTNGQTSYCSGSALTYVQSDVDVAAAAASEFTILPLDGLNQFLYVDGMDGRGAQVYWDTAFEQMSSDAGSLRCARTIVERCEPTEHACD